ncbi:hypothetical protein TNCV_2289821 [Trichonephila clavipes]|uniref:Uncharacterized protein n=1 Tax=Trichonephila clavipes TaxID=2585209 RepID=A0A8X6V5V4_TRICX|nr:hypothetical protein TNCV_2289821 [Trichonephila clavipes]
MPYPKESPIYPIFIANCCVVLHAEIVEVEIEVVSPSIVPSGNFAELNRTVTCMVLKANDRRTSCPCHDEFRGPRSDYNMFHMTTTTGEKTFQTSDKPSNGRVQHVRMYGGYFSVDRIFQFRQT